MKEKYYTLDKIYKFVQNGGMCYGEGSFGGICDITDIYKKIPFLLHMYVYNKDLNIWEFKSETLDLDKFIIAFRDHLVFKYFKADVQTELEGFDKIFRTIFNTKRGSIQNIEIANSTILFISNHNNFDTVFKYIEIGEYKFMLYRKMTGDMIHYIENIQILPTYTKFLKICELLKILHERNLYHNDIKLENILYRFFENKDGQIDYEFALCDYGLISNVHSGGTPETTCPYYLYQDDRGFTKYIEYYKSTQDKSAIVRHFIKNANSGIYAFRKKEPEFYSMMLNAYMNIKVSLSVNDLFGLHKSLHIIYAFFGKIYDHEIFLNPQTNNPYIISLVTSGGKMTLQTFTRGTSTYKIITEKLTYRKYIKIKSDKWYLDEHRGKYRYSDNIKANIYLLKSHVQEKTNLSNLIIKKN